MKGYMGEFIGRPLVVTDAPGVHPLPMESLVVDETMNMLYVRRRSGGRVIALPKHGLKGRLLTEEGETSLIGDELRVRPEDRIKRFARMRRESR